MSGYSKLWSEIVTSSIWSQDDKTRIVWVTILALKDQHGYIPASIPGLANASRVSVEDCEKAVSILESPDKYSRSTEHEGRRIEKVDGGWLVLNHTKYRDRKGISSDPTAAERQKRYRERHNSNGKVTDSNGGVTLCNVTPVSVSVSVLEEKRVKGEEKDTTRFTPPTPEEVTEFSKSIGYPMDGEAWCNSYEAKGWMIGKSKMKKWKAAVHKWKANGWLPGKPTSLSASPQPKKTYLPDTRTFTCPRCGKKGTLKDTISAQLGGFEDNEHLGQRCCGCYTDPYSGEFNFKIGKGKYPLAQIVELK